jgi:hypothetical protein
MLLTEACSLCGEDGKTVDSLSRHQGWDVGSRSLSEYVEYANSSFEEWFASFVPSWKRYNSKRKVLTALNKMSSLPDTGVDPEAFAALLQRMHDRMTEMKAAETAGPPPAPRRRRHRSKAAEGGVEEEEDAVVPDLEDDGCDNNGRADGDSITGDAFGSGKLADAVSLVDQVEMLRDRQDRFASAVADYMESVHPGIGGLLLEFYRAGGCGTGFCR